MKCVFGVFITCKGGYALANWIHPWENFHESIFEKIWIELYRGSTVILLKKYNRVPGTWTMFDACTMSQVVMSRKEKNVPKTGTIRTVDMLMKNKPRWNSVSSKMHYCVTFHENGRYRVFAQAKASIRQRQWERLFDAYEVLKHIYIYIIIIIIIIIITMIIYFSWLFIITISFWEQLYRCVLLLLLARLSNM